MSPGRVALWPGSTDRRRVNPSSICPVGCRSQTGMPATEVVPQIDVLCWDGSTPARRGGRSGQGLSGGDCSLFGESGWDEDGGSKAKMWLVVSAEAGFEGGCRCDELVRSGFERFFSFLKIFFTTCQTCDFFDGSANGTGSQMRDDSPLQETDKLPPTSARDAHSLPNKGRWWRGVVASCRCSARPPAPARGCCVRASCPRAQQCHEPPHCKGLLGMAHVSI